MTNGRKKIYKDTKNFDNEKNVYQKLKGVSYIPKFIDINEINKEILIEKIKVKDFFNYLKENNKIPTNFLKELKKIRLKFLEYGFYEWGDFYKSDHIFVSEPNLKNESNLIVIDFDSISTVREDEILGLKNQILLDFKKLNSDKEYFKEKFQIDDDNIVNDFFNNKII